MSNEYLFTRRTFLHAAAATTAGLALGSSARAAVKFGEGKASIIGTGVKVPTRFAAFANGSYKGSTATLRDVLRLEDLRRRAAQANDTLDSAAATRLLASVFVQASFYEPRRYLAKGDTLSALRMYALAQSIHPEDTQLCTERDQLFRAFAASRKVAPDLACARQ